MCLVKKCPFCKGEKLVPLGRGSILHRSYEKTEEYHYAMNSSTKIHQWAKDYITNKMLCVRCGMVHEYMNEQALKEYLENEPYAKP